MALHPESVDLGELPAKGEKVFGTMWQADLLDSVAEFGQETIDATVDIAVEEVKHRLAHRDLYLSHGMSLTEGAMARKGVKRPSESGRPHPSPPPEWGGVVMVTVHSQRQPGWYQFRSG